MPQISLDATGVSKASLIEGAYEFCGLNGFEFDKTAEEMVAGLRHLNAMMADWAGDGINLGYDFPLFGNGNLAEPSGVPDSAVAAIHGLLAQRLAPGLGASLSADARAAISNSWFRLRGRTAARPPSYVALARIDRL